jgi:transposase-like protein
MTGGKYKTEKIRIWREADQSGSIIGVCREHNIGEETFHRWKGHFK